MSGMSDTWHIIQIRGYDLPVFNMVYIHVYMLSDGIV